MKKTGSDNDVEKMDLCPVGGCIKWYGCYVKTSKVVPQKIFKIELYDPAITSLGIY